MTINHMALADGMRSILGIETAWFKVGNHCLSADEAFHIIREQCTAARITVMMNGVVRDDTHRTLDRREFRAFALVDDYAPLIFINRADTDNGRLFSLVHEVAHIFLGKDELFNAQPTHRIVNPVESLCNAAAAELLMPQSFFEQQWEEVTTRWQNSDEVFASLRRSFPVSEVTIARRALDHGLINQSEYDQCAQMAEQAAERRSREKQNGGDYYVTKQSRLDHGFLQRLANSVDEGRTSYMEAFRLSGTTRSTYPRFLEEVGLR